MSTIHSNKTFHGINISTSCFRYSATGNTFLVFDNRLNQWPLRNRPLWNKTAQECNVDGLLFVENSLSCDFKMRYLNRDGLEVEMCGNGGRVLSVFAHHELKLPLQKNWYHFETMNGIYRGRPSPPLIEMTELKEIDALEIDDLYPSLFSLYLNTGVPHCVYCVEHLSSIDVAKWGRKIRENRRFPQGANINFLQKKSPGLPHQFQLRTFERGVERETLSCGTGAVAAAVALHQKTSLAPPIELHCLGGVLTVQWEKEYHNLFLQGDVKKLDEREINL